MQYGGAVWRFCNFGNRAAFAERPDVYMPQFGGYDPVGVARGVAVAGRPDVWLISDGRLFLFYDSHRLETFAADPERFSSAAERKWPEILRTLSPLASLGRLRRRWSAPGEEVRNPQLRGAVGQRFAVAADHAASGRRRMAWPAATSQSWVGPSRG